jgi:hypothetical protein
VLDTKQEFYSIAFLMFHFKIESCKFVLYVILRKKIFIQKEIDSKNTGYIFKSFLGPHQKDNNKLLNKV